MLPPACKWHSTDPCLTHPPSNPSHFPPPSHTLAADISAPALPLPQAVHLHHALLTSIAFPMNQQPAMRPSSILVAYRCLRHMHAFGPRLAALGIMPMLESEEEARRSSAAHDTDHLGYNMAGDEGYKEEEYEGDEGPPL